MSYKYSDLYSAVNQNLHNKLGVLPNARMFFNNIVRDLTNEVDVDDTIRVAPLSPDLFSNIAVYTPPIDVKSDKYVQIRKETKDNREESYKYVDPQWFNEHRGRIFTTEYRDGNKVLRIDAIEGYSTIISEFEDVSIVSAVGVTSDIIFDDARYYSGSGSIKFNIHTGANGVSFSLDENGDYTTYFNNGYFHVGFYLPKDVDITTITSTTLRVGIDAGNYYEIALDNNTILHAGLNILGFKGVDRNATGAPDIANVVYFELHVITTGDILEAGVDYLVASVGRAHEATYYSKYPWRTAATQVWKLESTMNDDELNLDSDAFDLAVVKGTIQAAPIVREMNDLKIYEARYYGDSQRPGMLKSYQQKHPSRALNMKRAYIDIDALDTDREEFNETVVRGEIGTTLV